MLYCNGDSFDFANDGSLKLIVKRSPEIKILTAKLSKPHVSSVNVVLT